MGIESAVVNQRPGSCGESGVGSTDIDVAIGICRDKDMEEVRLM